MWLMCQLMIHLLHKLQVLFSIELPVLTRVDFTSNMTHCKKHLEFSEVAQKGGGSFFFILNKSSVQRLIKNP